MNILLSLRSFIIKHFQRQEMKKKGLVQSKKKKRLKQDDGLGNAADNSKTLGILILFAIWSATVVMLVVAPAKEMDWELTIGKKSPSTIYADFDFSYEDKVKTKEKMEQAKKGVPLIFKLDSRACTSSVSKAKKLFHMLSALSDSADSQAMEKLKKFPKTFNALRNTSPGIRSALNLLLADDKRVESILRDLQECLYRGVMRPAIAYDGYRTIRILKGNSQETAKLLSSVSTLEDVKKAVAKKAVEECSPNNRLPLIKLLRAMISDVTTSTLIFDPIASKINQNSVAASVAPVYVKIAKDSLIAEKGVVVDRETLLRSDAYKKTERSNNLLKDMARKFLTSACVSLLLIMVSGLYISHVHPEIVESNQKMGLIATVVIIAIAANFFAIDSFYRFCTVLGLHPELLVCLLPVALAAITLSVLIGLRVAFFAGLFVSLIAGMQLNDSFSVVIMGMVVSGLSAFAVRYRTNYKSFFFHAAASIGISIPLIRILYIWAYGGSWTPLMQVIICGVFNGVVVSACSLFFIFVLEWIFQISSNMTLLLLCDYNHPLLKRLQMEAPGTYHHSLVVSTLAEQAAQAIGADPIKARVISLFHDIGKMVKPEYYTENQQSEESKHSKLNPRMSSLVILNHVKEGVDMALKHKLRKIIRDGIEQHHGTDLIFYFYQQALEEGRKKAVTVDEHDYRYPGPLPKEKEVVILSLADSCEAASRSLQKPTPPKIDALVWEIFRKRIRNGQLDGADLTFGELKQVRESFVATLTTMMHGRIAYPKDETEEENEGDLFAAAKQKGAPPSAKKT